jgi:hypothetical protein
VGAQMAVKEEDMGARASMSCMWGSCNGARVGGLSPLVLAWGARAGRIGGLALGYGNQ